MSDNDPIQDSVPPQSPPASQVPAVVVDTTGISADERQWAMLAHLSALLGYMVTAGWAGAVGGFLGPLIVWSMKKDTMPFVDQQGKEALNFSITICLAFAVLFVAMFPIGIVTLGLGLIPIVLAMLVVGLYALVFTIIASIKANEGVHYRYPIALRLIK